MEAKRYINHLLAESQLSPGSVAASLGIAVGTLHSGTSFARDVSNQRRKERGTALLANPKRPVTDIAFARGFRSLSGFYRVFQAAFGMSPSEMRAQSARGS